MVTEHWNKLRKEAVRGCGVSFSGYLKSAWIHYCAPYCRESSLAGDWTSCSPEVPSNIYNSETL